MSRTYGNFIDGEWTDSQSGETFEVTNPAAAGEVVSIHPASTEADVEAALDAAVAAQDEWASTPGPSRGAILREAGNNLEARKDEATEVLVREEGKTRSEAGGEVQRAIDIFHYYGAKARDVGGTVKSASAPGKDLYTKHEPLGTVALITPWNYPIAIPVWKLAPALAAGNTVVLKPASEAPGVVAIVLECLGRRGPAGRRCEHNYRLRERGRRPAHRERAHRRRLLHRQHRRGDDGRRDGRGRPQARPV